jgi:hypothetical protein
MFSGGQSSREDGLGKTTYGAAKLEAQDTVCQSNLGQVRTALELAKQQDEDAKPPANLDDTRLGSTFYECPIGHEKYVYDATTGRVSCPHPGHQNY